MSYKIKNGVESFKVVDGPYAGRSYERGKEYEDIPPEEAHRFEDVVETNIPKTKLATKKTAPADEKEVKP